MGKLHGYSECQRKAYRLGATRTDCVQEEIWRQAKFGSHANTEEEENIALASKRGKGKGKKKIGEIESSTWGKKKKNLNKVKCFSCHRFGHYSTKCPNMKESKNDHVASSTEVEELNS